MIEDTVITAVRNRSRATGYIHARLALGLLALVILVTSCNGGGAPVQVGSNLNVAPNNGLTCQDGFPIQINPTFPQPLYLQGASSCSVMTFFDGAQPSVPGTVVSANIRVGNVTGPMRFVRMRILFTNTQSGYDRACCSAEQFSEVFTPTANAVTNVALNFSMTTTPPRKMTPSWPPPIWCAWRFSGRTCRSPVRGRRTGAASGFAYLRLLPGTFGAIQGPDRQPALGGELQRFPAVLQPGVRGEVSLELGAGMWLEQAVQPVASTKNTVQDGVF